MLFGIRRALALQAPPVIKIQQQENRAISTLDVEQLCALIREERAEELARACMSSNAARQRLAAYFMFQKSDISCCDGVTGY